VSFPSNSVIHRGWLVDIVFLIIILTIFYTLWLGGYPVFTPDEGRYSEVAREMVSSGDYITPHINGVAFLDKPVLYYWFQAFAINLFGVQEWALRLFPALFGVLGGLITYICGRRLYDRQTALLATIILTTSPLYFGASHFANLDLEVAVMISCCLLCVITGLQLENKSRSYFLFTGYIFAALAFLTKGFIGVVFPTMILGCWILLLGRWDTLRKMHLLWGTLLFTGLVLPWYTMVQKANPEFIEYFFFTQQVTRFLSGVEFNNKVPFWFYIPIICLGFFPWTIFLVQTLSRTIRQIWSSRTEHNIELFLILWVSIIFLFFSIPHSKTMGYILPIFPALALLVGNYVSSNWRTAKQSTIRLGAFSFIMMGCLLASLLFLLKYTNWFNIPEGFFIYLNVILGVLLIAVLINFFFLRKASFLPLFLTCLFFSVSSLLILTQSAFYLNNNTLKPLISNLKQIIKPDDEVINYFRFYQDVPLYLGKRVTVVADWNAPDISTRDNWLRELWYGIRFQNDADGWLINDKEFWKRWNGNNRVFVFMHINDFVNFQPIANRYFHLGKYNNVVLLSNKPTV
jgi:4-amino-4-deoxy-L-arabinose transferase-like glycosyltransferase